MRVVKWWVLRRRINRILREAGLPRAARGVFKGEIIMSEVRYPE